MTKPTTVAVLVHNDVVRDARVRKEVRTLTDSGFTVDVFGISRGDSYPERLEGARRLVLIDLPEMRPGVTALPWKIKKLALAFFSILFSLGIIATIRFIFIDPLRVAVSVAKSPNRRLEETKKWVRNRNIVRWRYHRMANALAQQVRKDRYDVIHAHDIIALIAGQRLKREGVASRLIWDAHELYEHIDYPDPSTRSLISKTIKEAVPYIDQVITINESFRRYYSEHHHLPPPHVVMNATRFDPAARDYDGRLHDAAGVERNQRILLFQGGLAPNRGISVLLEAAADLPKNWTLVFMGWGALQPEIEAARKRLQCNQRSRIALVLPAQQSELRAWTAGATLGAIPYENTSRNHLYCTPNKLWEYPNAGVPILATDLEEMGRIIREWDTGVLLPRSFAASDIVAAVQKLDDTALDHLRKACCKFSEEMSWTRFQPTLLAAYGAVG